MPENLTRGLPAALLAGLLSRCATYSVDHFPDGSTGFTTSCSGVGRTWDMCRQTAANLCGSADYKALSTTGDLGSLGTPEGGNLFQDNTLARVLLLQCNKP